MYYRVEVYPLPHCDDPRGLSLIGKAKDVLGYELSNVRTSDVFSIFADITLNQAQAFASSVANQVIQGYEVGEKKDHKFNWVIVIGFLPGVTDNVSRSARAMMSDVTGRQLSHDEAIYSSVEYFITADLNEDQVKNIASELLYNQLIESAVIMPYSQWQELGTPVNEAKVVSEITPVCNLIDLNISDEALMQMSREKTLALNLEEMKAIQSYFQHPEVIARRLESGLSAEATDVELEMLAQTWSEHCSHKIFAANVDYTDDQGKNDYYKSLYKTFIQKSTKEIGEEVDWLVSVFKDNAGVIKFNEKVDLVYKVETHNSPSALDPFGGAMTGIVGVNRDPMGTGIGANLLFNVWGYCLGSPFTPTADVPEGLLTPRRIRDGVHKGVICGGNESGIPYMYGWEYFDERYMGKPLVYCGTAGTLPVEVNGKRGSEKEIKVGDIIVMVGGEIGKDGIHGATFSSEELHKDSPVQAVQIGDPITQKKVGDFIYEARDKGLYRFVTDNGAGGISSSVGEMAEETNGAVLDVGKAPLKYAGMHPWEILVSEAQERMSFAVPPEKLESFLALAKKRDVLATALGHFTDNGLFQIQYNGAPVGQLDMEFLHDGCPKMTIKATWQPPVWEEPTDFECADLGEAVADMVGRLNICSNEYKARQYDHEVKGQSVLKPFGGVNMDVANDASISMIEPLSTEGVILTAGIAPRYSDIDTYHMTSSVIDMAVRKTIAVGGSLGHIAGLDNYCWPDPVESVKTPDGQYKMAQLVRSCQALYDYSKSFQVPCISGKDSCKNDSTIGDKKISIPPTLLFSSIAKMDDITTAIDLSAKNAGDLLYVIGNTKKELGGSEYYSSLGYVGNSVPKVDVEVAKSTYAAVSEITKAGLVKSLTTPCFGGLAVSFAKKAIAGAIGLEIDLAKIPTESTMTNTEILFSESNSRFVATVSPENKIAFEAALEGICYAQIGCVVTEPTVTFKDNAQIVSSVTIDKLTYSYKNTLTF
ncbi:MAG: AIR synthase-related protein [Lentisphaeria bacterium]